MLAAISIGPVAVAVEADTSEWHLYEGGVMDFATCGRTLDHGVLVVGYGTDNSVGISDYYMVKNSWGMSWGEKGYMRIVRGKDMCGIADAATLPTGVTNSTPMPPVPPSPSPSMNYTVQSLATGGMQVWEFVVEGSHAAELQNQLICIAGLQTKLSSCFADAEPVDSGGTLCSLAAHTAFRSIAKVGDTFAVGLCP